MQISMMEKIGLGALVTVTILWTGHMIGEVAVSAEKGDIEALRIPTGESTEVAAAADEEPEVDFATLLASADAAAGERVFKKCASCHSFEAGAGHKVGPNLYGVVGRAIGSADGYSYSDALSGHGGTWTPEELASFLESPSDFAPGNKMTFRGLSKPEDRAEVIVYLQSAQ